MEFNITDKNAVIAVAMSGGVDSSTTAALLHHHGFKNLFGITLKLYQNDEASGIFCKDTKFEEDAKRVANGLGIPHYTLDVEDTFRAKVIAPFINSYASGLTPSPCITCNKEIKFGEMLAQAEKLGAEYLITGHYIKWATTNGFPSIYMNSSAIRDQSYFLAKIRKDALRKIRFPLADLTKEQVRQIADKYGLHVAQKAASNDICFAGGKGYTNVLNKAYTEQQKKEGYIVDLNGKIIGEHKGIHNFTVGQRKGLGISSSEPIYVLSIDAQTHNVMVGPRAYLAKNEITTSDVNWLGEDKFTDEPSRILDVKVRASQELVPATVSALGQGRALVEFSQPIFGVSPGQICAFYKDGRLLGGANI